MGKVLFLTRHGHGQVAESLCIVPLGTWESPSTDVSCTPCSFPWVLFNCASNSPRGYRCEGSYLPTYDGEVWGPGVERYNVPIGGERRDE